MRTLTIILGTLTFYGLNGFQLSGFGDKTVYAQEERHGLGTFPESRSYYVAEMGTGDCSTENTPCDLAVLRGSTLNAGDRLFFNRGDEFHLINFDVIADDIKIDAYGVGDAPVFRGSKDISKLIWVNEGDGTYSTVLEQSPKWLFINDTSARLAETGWIQIINVPGPNVRRVKPEALNLYTGNIVGAIMRVKEYSFRLSSELTITNYNSTNGNITFVGNLVRPAGGVGMPIKLFNEREFIVNDGDWVFDSSTNILYVKTSTHPSEMNIKTCVADYGFSFENVNNCSVKNVEMMHYYRYSIESRNAANISITQSSFHDNRTSGLLLDGTEKGTLVDNCEIYNHGLCGLEHGALQGGKFSNNRIYNIGLQASIGFPIDTKTGGTGIAPIIKKANDPRVANNLVIERNEIYSIGYQGMMIFGNNHLIQYNHIRDYCRRWTDGGAIHLYYTNSFKGSTSGVVCRYNIIHNGVGNTDGIKFGGGKVLAGIYHDAGIKNCTIDHNFIFDPGNYGVFCNFWNTANTITNNQISGALISQVEIRQNSTQNKSYPFSAQEKCILTGNVLVSKFSPSRNLSLYNEDGAAFNPFSKIDNNVYVHPYETTIARSFNGRSFVQMTLPQWQSYTGSDSTSTSYVNYMPGRPTLNDVKEEYNFTGQPVTFRVPTGYVDSEGKPFHESIVIPPYFGLIYLKAP